MTPKPTRKNAKKKSIRFADDVKDGDDSAIKDPGSETEGSETEGSYTESSSSETSETDSDDQMERENLEDDVFSSRSIESKKIVKAIGIPLHPESDARVVFKIRDPDPHAITALRREFKDCPEVLISCGDHFKEADQCDAMVIPMTNAFGFLDQPPELQYNQRFPSGLQERLRAAIVAEEDGELLIGDSLILLAGSNIKALDTIGKV